MPTNHTTVPDGWFRLGWSADFAAGEVKTFHYFDQELVAYRGESGQVHVFDAYCQHLGAHLGVGGCVEGDEIICPFHGWRWAADGRSAKIPYEDRTSYRKLRKWPVNEQAGMVFVWHGAGEPTWEMPIFPSSTPAGESFYPIFPNVVNDWRNKRVHPQNIQENLADPAHIKYVHKAGSVASVPEAGPDGAVFSATIAYVFGEGRKSTWLTPNGPVDLKVKTKAYGLGFQITHYEGLHDAIQITGSTPIDLLHSDIWMTALIPIKAGEDENTPNERWLRLFRQMCGQMEEDLPIWAKMIYIDHPPFPVLEAKNYRSLRQWANQFYPREPVRERKSSVANLTSVSDENA